MDALTLVLIWLPPDANTDARGYRTVFLAKVEGAAHELLGHDRASVECPYPPFSSYLVPLRTGSRHVTLLQPGCCTSIPLMFTEAPTQASI